LDAGETLSDSHTFRAGDGSAQVVFITIAGAGEGIEPDSFFEISETNSGPDPFVAGATYEDPAIAVEQTPLARENPASGSSADGQDQSDHSQDPAADEDEEIILLTEEVEGSEEIFLLTEEVETDIQPEGRHDVRFSIDFGNALNKDINLAKYVKYNYTAPENKPIQRSASEFNPIEFNTHDPKAVEINDGYDVLRQELDEAFDSELKSQGIRTKIITISTASFTVGIVSYLVRAGSMVASLMSSLPLWRGYDPIAIYTGGKKKQKDRSEMPNPDELKSENIFDGDAE
jgi:hypothetical protein